MSHMLYFAAENNLLIVLICKFINEICIYWIKLYNIVFVNSQYSISALGTFRIMNFLHIFHK